MDHYTTKHPVRLSAASSSLPRCPSGPLTCETISTPLTHSTHHLYSQSNAVVQSCVWLINTNRVTDFCKQAESRSVTTCNARLNETHCCCPQALANFVMSGRQLSPYAPNISVTNGTKFWFFFACQKILEELYCASTV